MIVVTAMLAGSCADECAEYEYGWAGSPIGFFDDWMEVTHAEVVAPDEVDLDAHERRVLGNFRSGEARMLRALRGQLLRGESFERGLTRKSAGEGVARVLDRGGSVALGHTDGSIAAIGLRTDGSIEWLGRCEASATDQISDFAAHLAETDDEFAGAEAVDVVRALVAEEPDGPLSRRFEEWWHPTPTDR